MVGYFAILLAIALLPGGGIHSAAVIAAWYFLYHRPQKKEEAERDERWKKESEERQKQLVRQEEEKLNREVKSRAFETKLASDPVAARNFLFESLNIAKHYRGNGDFFVLLQTLAKAIGTPHKVVFLKRVPLTKTGGNSWGDARNEGAQHEFHVLDAHDNVLAKVSSTYLANSQDGLIHGELYSRNDEFEFREFWFRLPDKREVEVSYFKHSCHRKTVEETFEITPPDFSIQDLGNSPVTQLTKKDDGHPVSREAAGSIAVVEKRPSTPSRTCPHCMRAFSQPLQAGSDLHCPHCMYKISASDQMVVKVKWSTCTKCQTFFDSVNCPNGCPTCAISKAEENSKTQNRLSPVQTTTLAESERFKDHPKCSACNSRLVEEHGQTCSECRKRIARVQRFEEERLADEKRKKENEELKLWITQDTHPVRGDGLCDFRECTVTPFVTLGENHYCLNHTPKCGIKGCTNRATTVSNAKRFCARHYEEAEVSSTLGLIEQIANLKESEHVKERPRCISCNSSFVDGPGQTCPSCRKRNAKLQRLEEERLSDEKRKVENSPYEIIARRRCKVCNLDVALGYISDENICMYCAEELKPKSAPRVTVQKPVSAKVTTPTPNSKKAPAPLDTADDFGDRMKALHKITPTDMCCAGECERHADLRLDGKLYCLAHYHMAKSALEARNTGIKSSLNPSATWPFPNGSG